MSLILFSFVLLIPGTALVLKDLAILISNKVPHVIITENCLVTLLCQDESEKSQFSRQNVCNVSHQELSNLQSQIEKENKIIVANSVISLPSSTTSSASSLFTTFRAPSTLNLTRPSQMVYSRPPIRPTFQRPPQFTSNASLASRPRAPYVQHQRPRLEPNFQGQVQPSSSKASVTSSVASSSNGIIDDDGVDDLLKDIDEDSLFGEF